MRWTATCSRRQARAETPRALDALVECEVNASELIFDQATLRCFLGLRGHESAREWIGKAEDHLAAQDSLPFSGAPFYRSHAAIYLNRWGEPEAARALLEPCLADGRLGQGFPHIFGRCQLAMSEVLRLTKEPDLERARELASEAVERYRRVEYEGALADFGLSQWAKIEAQAGQPGRALELLEEAREIQKRLHIPSLLRTVCLTARIDQGLSPRKRRAKRREAEVIIGDRSGFQQCPLAREIVYRWDDWCAGAPQPNAPGAPDDFWGV